MTERKYVLAFGKDYLNPRTSRKEATAERIIDAFRKFHVIPLTQAEYAALDAKGKAVQKKASGFVIGGDFGEGKKKEDCKFRSVVTLDMDDLTPETAAVSQGVLQKMSCKGFLYSTASHTPEKPRLRAFIFLQEDVPPEQYESFIQYFMNRLPAGAVSSESRKVSQIMFRPQRCTDGEELFIELSGEPLDPMEVMAQVVPTAARKGEVTPAWEKSGIVGRVAARFEGNFDQAIEELGLPYERSKVGPTCGSGEDRYSYTEGAGADGAVWYANDGHLFSHHGTDPCRDRNCTIFDVWRLHNTGASSEDDSTPIAERASHKAAEAFFVAKYPELGRQVASSDELEDISAGIASQMTSSTLLTIDTNVDSAPSGRFKIISADKFVTGKPLEWWIKKVIPKAELGLIYGQSGSGKSFFAYDLVARVHMGEPWRGYKARQGDAVYVCAEGMAAFEQRIAAYAKKHDKPLSALCPVIPEAPNLLEVDDVKDLIASLKSYGKIALVVIDTLSATTPGGNENASEDVGRALAHCKAIHRHTGAMVVLIHHSGKDASKGARGWSGVWAAMDFVIEVNRTGDARVAALAKSKDGEDGIRWPFELEIVDLGKDADGDVISSCVPEHLDGEVPAALRSLNPAQQTVFDETRRLILNGITRARDIYDAAKLKLVVDEGTRDRRNQQVRRLIQQIVDKGGRLYLHNGGESITLTPSTEASVVEFEE